MVRLMTMSKLAKICWVLCVLALAGGAGVLIGWLFSRQGDVQPIAVAPGSNPPIIAIAPMAITAEAADKRAVAARPGLEAGGLMAPAPEENADWEKQLDDILLSDTDPTNKADRILALIPTAPTNAQVELSQHLVNMVQDDHYEGAAQLLTNTATPAAVSTVLMNDLLNRNNSLKLPMLLAVARQEDHPLKDQAREMLVLLLQVDDGSNWDQWSAAITTWLQDNSQ